MSTEPTKSEISSERFLTNESGKKLFCKYWSTNPSVTEVSTVPRALLFIVHGLAEHCLYYEEIANVLTKDGIFVFSHDHQGHGQSEGKRCLIKDLREYTRDIFMHIDLLKKEHPSLPVFLLGHSMGGALSILAGMDRPDYFKGIILLSPLVLPESDDVGPIRIFFGKIVARLFPNFPVLYLGTSDMSRDPAVCQKYEDDPLVYHGGVKAGTGLALLQATLEIESKLDTITFPFLVVHGTHDKILPPEGAKKVYEKAASSDKTLKMFQDCFHQIHNELEPCKTEVMEDFRFWISQRLSEEGNQR